MLISIIVPFYNVEPYFRRCLDSIVNQSYRNIEIILINDCSPDNSIAIAREYAAKDDRIRIIEHERNLGLGGARNSGMAAAKGEYIWFIDSDDLIASNYAVVQLVDIAQKKHPEVIIFNSHTLIEDGYTERHYSYYPYAQEQHFDDQRPFAPVFTKALLTGNKSQGYFGAEVWTKWFHRDFLKKIEFKFLEHTIHEDEPLRLALGFAQQVVISPMTHYYHYHNPNSIMNSKLPADYDQHVKRAVNAICHTSLHHPLKHLLEPNTGIIAATRLLRHHLRRVLSRAAIDDHLKVYESWYNILAELPELRHALLAMEIWPDALGKEQAWRSLLQSFTTPISTIEQQSLWIDIIQEKKREVKPTQENRIEVKPTQENRIEVKPTQENRIEVKPTQENSIEVKPTQEKKKKVNPFKKAIKMLLPHGVIRYIQIQKKKRG